LQGHTNAQYSLSVSRKGWNLIHPIHEGKKIGVDFHGFDRSSPNQEPNTHESVTILVGQEKLNGGEKKKLTQKGYYQDCLSTVEQKISGGKREMASSHFSTLSKGKSKERYGG